MYAELCWLYFEFPLNSGVNVAETQYQLFSLLPAYWLQFRHNTSYILVTTPCFRHGSHTDQQSASKIFFWAIPNIFPLCSKYGQPGVTSKLYGF